MTKTDVHSLRFCLFWIYLMAIIKEAALMVSSYIESAENKEDFEKSETRADAFIKDSGDSLTLSYLEEQQGDRIFTDVTLENGTVEVKRRGGIECDFLFKEGESTYSKYAVGPYCFDASIYTKKIRGAITRTGGTLTIFYDMEIGGDKRSVRMKIEAECK